jgi:hypothetical protein
MLLATQISAIALVDLDDGDEHNILADKQNPFKLVVSPRLHCSHFAIVNPVQTGFMLPR